MTQDKEPRRPTTDIIIVVSLVACFAMILWPTVGRSISSWRMTGQEAPEISLFDLQTGERVALSSFRGRVVVLDFWATWCPPCRKQMPAVEALARDSSLSNKAQILSINTNKVAPDRKANVQAFMKMKRYSMKTVLDDGSASRAFHVDSIPTLVILDSNGRIRHIDNGVHSESKLRALIQEASVP